MVFTITFLSVSFVARSASAAERSYDIDTVSIGVATTIISSTLFHIWKGNQSTIKQDFGLPSGKIKLSLKNDENFGAEQFLYQLQ